MNVGNPDMVGDFIPVPDEPAGGVGETGGGAGGGGAGAAGGEDGGAEAPVCTPRAAGRFAPDFGQVELPDGAIGANPHFEHLTGLESWFWYEGGTTLTWESPVFVGVAADCSVVPAPPAETYRAELVGFVWQVDDGRNGHHRADRAGSEERPAVRHVYETKGPRTVTVQCTWAGAWGAQLTTPCGQRQIDVIEVRGRFRSDP